MCRREGRRKRQSGKSAHVRDDKDEKHGHGRGSTPDIESEHRETNRRQGGRRRGEAGNILPTLEPLSNIENHLGREVGLPGGNKVILMGRPEDY